ncbi:hypothetical protein M378DRAFT_180679 [Amanita muscaria Koide BX008]|uniref:Uncharacterized protein n=1 Tax=Amanita muscaria (strain Koide BX008) TaxID=946122 RepID=A0A0C2SAJ5_AMAMK|nr:hypothetical protein M378DRAFT_180679 [Amanita muscaria Koide BX008]
MGERWQVLAVATSSDHVDVATAPLHPGQLKPTHSRFVSHHRHEGGENGFHRHQFTDDRYPSKDKRGEHEAHGEPASLTSTNNLINPCLRGQPGSHTDGKHISGGGSCNPSPMGGIPKHKHKRQWRGAASQAAAVRNAQAQALRAKLHQLEAPRPPPTTYRAVENRGKALFGRSPNSVKVDANAMRQAEQRNRATQLQIDNLRKEQKMANQRIPGGGRRVTQQYTMSEPKSLSSAFGG